VAHCHRGEPHAHRYRAGADRRLGAEVLAQPGKVQRAEDGTDPEGAEHHAVEPGAALQAIASDQRQQGEDRADEEADQQGAGQHDLDLG